MQSVVDLFERHLRGLMGRPLLAGYDRYDVRFAIEFRDLGQWWRLDVKGGAIVAIRGPLEDSEKVPVWFVVDEEVLLEIARGEISPQRAFFARRTEIRGNLFEGMKLAKLMGMVFERYPYCGKAEV